MTKSSSEAGRVAPKHHRLKCWSPYFEDVASGRKPFECRKNDRDFQEGDLVTLLQYDPQARTFTGQAWHGRITYMLGNFPCSKPELAGYCVFAVAPVAPLPSAGVDPERVAILTAHRACNNQEQDAGNGKLAGYCVVCGVPWPCEYAGKPPVAIPPLTAGTGVGDWRKCLAEVEEFKSAVKSSELYHWFPMKMKAFSATLDRLAAHLEEAHAWEGEVRVALGNLVAHYPKSRTPLWERARAALAPTTTKTGENDA